MRPINLYEYKSAAREAMSQPAFDYYRSGANDEVTLRDNHTAYDRIALHYRVLRDISERSLETTVMGHRLAMPVLIAPTAFHGLAHRDAELATVRAAGDLGTAMVLSSLSNEAMEDVTAAATGPVWFQLYVAKDREVTRGMVQRAAAAGCQALVLTVDAPLIGRRERDVRNRFQLPTDLEMKNLLPIHEGKFPDQFQGSGLAAYASSYFDTSLSWKDLEWLASLSDLPLWIKGVVRPDDAVRAAEHGATGVIVSNHGGRQLDTSPATIDVLPGIVDAAGDRLEILIDGGIRRGTDVIKALAIGARAVLIGRPVLWGLAVGGRKGARHVLELLRDEIDLALGLCGCRSVAELDRSLVGLREH